MSVVVNKAKEEIKNIIIGATNAAMADGSLPNAELTDFVIEVPANRTHGDYAINAAMVWSRLFRCAPRQIAETILSHVDFEGSYIEKCEIAGPGFINLFLSQKYYADIVADVEAVAGSLGASGALSFNAKYYDFKY
jgi:arginyl-tRNA synthetase